ncbi:hypothetical protein ACFP81_05120 [Deinococcus lacus]|uniref:Uncharacterized protein n=1 Tax=Deinococcus lacus TaxID=392561 RepID=A0ABW1YBT5_9DEIO
MTPNIRPDGSRTGITTALAHREDHSVIAYPQSQATAWISAQARALALEWRRQDAGSGLPPTP